MLNRKLLIDRLIEHVGASKTSVTRRVATAILMPFSVIFFAILLGGCDNVDETFPPPPQMPPFALTAVNDSASTTVDTAVVINVLANDSDPDGDPLTVSTFDAVSVNGNTVNCTAAGSCTYTPTGGFSGTDTFSYTAFDGVDTDTATVTVTVSGPVGDPVAGQARYDAECHVCHEYQDYGDNTELFGAGDLGGQGNKLRNNLGRIDSLMNGIRLTDQEILDVAAFLDNL